MRLFGTMRINAQGRLEIGGCDTVELAERYGTPLVVIDEDLVRWNCRAYRQAAGRLRPQGRVVYAGKAFLALPMAAVVREEGLGLDVVSGGELFTALRAGVQPETLIFHGNNKSPEEIEMAVAHGVGRVAVDNLQELRLLSRVAEGLRRRVRILLRLTPGVDPHTHSYIRTGQVDSKFGFQLEAQAEEAVTAALESPALELVGYHLHVGSQLLDAEAVVQAAQLVIAFAGSVRRRLGYWPEELDVGGGLGVRYGPEEEPESIGSWVNRVAEAVRQAVEAQGPEPLAVPALIFEPGRSIVAEAGTTLYRVGTVKEVPGIRRYVAVDGGMGDNPRVALYQARYEALLANRAVEPARDVVTVVGKYCESGDVLIRDARLPGPQPGDILAVGCTGAYHYSMASAYNRIPRPAVVAVREGESRLWVRRESYEDLIRLDVPVEPPVDVSVQTRVLPEAGPSAGPAAARPRQAQAGFRSSPPPFGKGAGQTDGEPRNPAALGAGDSDRSHLS